MAQKETAAPSYGSLMLWCMLGLATIVVPMGIIAINHFFISPHDWQTQQMLYHVFWVGLHASILGFPIAYHVGSQRSRHMMKFSHDEEMALMIGVGLNLLVGLFGLLVWVFHFQA